MVESARPRRRPEQRPRGYCCAAHRTPQAWLGSSGPVPGGLGLAACSGALFQPHRTYEDKANELAAMPSMGTTRDNPSAGLGRPLFRPCQSFPLPPCSLSPGRSILSCRGHPAPSSSLRTSTPPARPDANGSVGYRQRPGFRRAAGWRRFARCAGGSGRRTGRSACRVPRRWRACVRGHGDSRRSLGAVVAPGDTAPRPRAPDSISFASVINRAHLVRVCARRPIRFRSTTDCRKSSRLGDCRVTPRSVRFGAEATARCMNPGNSWRTASARGMVVPYFMHNWRADSRGLPRMTCADTLQMVSGIGAIWDWSCTAALVHRM